MILVLDYGSQYTQLIAKRLRRLGFKAEVIPGTTKADKLPVEKGVPYGIILSGSPASVGEGIDPDPKLLDLGVPVLGLCFGYHFLASHLGGKVEAQKHREYGAGRTRRTAAGRTDPLTKNFPDDAGVWMSHGDSVTQLPPGASLLLESHGQVSGFTVAARRFWGLQFHPEVHHTPQGDELFKSFARDICGLEPDWNLGDELTQLKAQLKEQLKGVDEVMCGVSGGVDSTVLAVLLSQVVKVRALFVDHGFLRDYDLVDLKKVFAKYPNIELEVVDARELFWSQLDGISDPEKKRKIIGKAFIDAFYGRVRAEAGKKSTHASGKSYLGQGTIYSDVIESAANQLGPAHLIKSHHNVGGLPEDLPFALVEPLRAFFKDEVREIGALLGIEKEALARHPFPGPGLAIRCVGELKPQKIEILAKCDTIFHEELLKRGLYHKTWQALVVLLPVSSVGVMGDGRSYESVVAIRCVNSVDAMTAEASELPWSDLKAIASRLVNEVKGVNRVVYDLTSKPPGTIEWE
jgi:GMP synthase (glutamine-hydrolysing)